MDGNRVRAERVEDEHIVCGVATGERQSCIAEHHRALLTTMFEIVEEPRIARNPLHRSIDLVEGPSRVRPRIRREGPGPETNHADRPRVGSQRLEDLTDRTL